MLASLSSRVSLCMSSVVVPAGIRSWPMCTAAARRTWIRIPGRVLSYPMIINGNLRHNMKNNENQTTSRRRGRFIKKCNLVLCSKVGVSGHAEGGGSSIREGHCLIFILLVLYTKPTGCGCCLDSNTRIAIPAFPKFWVGMQDIHEHNVESGSSVSMRRNFKARGDTNF